MTIWPYHAAIKERNLPTGNGQTVGVADILTSIENTDTLRFFVFLGLTVSMIIWEIISPRRQRQIGRTSRWPVNISLTILNTAIIQGIQVSIPLIIAWQTTQHGNGLIPSLNLHEWVDILLTWILLEMTIYWQHRLFHRIPLLWRLHRVHHSDQDLDVSSGFRFHPLEIILSLLIKLIAITILGAHPVGYLLFSFALSSGALFNHSNIYLPGKFDRWLQRAIVTPDMHRIHHSTDPKETDSNFSFTLNFDQFFGTYTKISFEDQPHLKIGLNEYQKASDVTFTKLLMMPFQKT